MDPTERQAVNAAIRAKQAQMSDTKVAGRSSGRKPPSTVSRIAAGVIWVAAIALLVVMIVRS